MHCHQERQELGRFGPELVQSSFEIRDCVCHLLAGPCVARRANRSVSAVCRILAMVSVTSGHTRVLTAWRQSPYLPCDPRPSSAPFLPVTDSRRIPTSRHRASRRQESWRSSRLAPLTSLSSSPPRTAFRSSRELTSTALRPPPPDYETCSLVPASGSRPNTSTAVCHRSLRSSSRCCSTVAISFSRDSSSASAAERAARSFSRCEAAARSFAAGEALPLLRCGVSLLQIPVAAGPALVSP